MMLFLPNRVFLEADRLTLKFIEKSKGPRTPDDKEQGRGVVGILPSETLILMMKARDLVSVVLATGWTDVPTGQNREPRSSPNMCRNDLLLTWYYRFMRKGRTAQNCSGGKVKLNPFSHHTQNSTPVFPKAKYGRPKFKKKIYKTLF